MGMLLIHHHYCPSRGAKHKEGQGDTWISLDPSWKQYRYSQGLDLQSAVPFDGQAFVEEIQATADINEAQGYATGVDALYVQQAMQDYQAQVKDYTSNRIFPPPPSGTSSAGKRSLSRSFLICLEPCPMQRKSKAGPSPPSLIPCAIS